MPLVSKRIKLAEEAEEHDIENQLNEVAVVFPEQQAYKDDEEGSPSGTSSYWMTSTVFLYGTTSLLAQRYSF